MTETKVQPQDLAAGVGGATLVTALPGSPIDGQEVVFTDSLTAPTFSWRFRYNAGSASSFKWEFVGGLDQRFFAETPQTVVHTNAAQYYDFPGPIPQLTVPRAGEYVLRFGVRQASLGGNYANNLTPKYGVAAAADADSIVFGQALLLLYGESPLKTFAAGDVIKLMSKCNTATGPATYAGTFMNLRPNRVS